MVLSPEASASTSHICSSCSCNVFPVTGRSLWQDLSSPQTLVMHVPSQRKMHLLHLLSLQLCSGTCYSPAGWGSHAAVCNTLPATAISSNIRLLIYDRYNFILQTCRVCSLGNNDSWVIMQKTNSLLVFTVIFKQILFYCIGAFSSVCGVYSLFQNRNVLCTSEYKICIVK